MPLSKGSPGYATLTLRIYGSQPSWLVTSLLETAPDESHEIGVAPGFKKIQSTVSMWQKSFGSRPSDFADELIVDSIRFIDEHQLSLKLLRRTYHIDLYLLLTSERYRSSFEISNETMCLLAKYRCNLCVSLRFDADIPSFLDSISQ